MVSSAKLRRLANLVSSIEQDHRAGTAPGENLSDTQLTLTHFQDLDEDEEDAVLRTPRSRPASRAPKAGRGSPMRIDKEDYDDFDDEEFYRVSKVEGKKVSKSSLGVMKGK